MTDKTRQVLGYTTIALIIGGTVYAVIAHKKQLKIEDSTISAQEARAEVEEYRAAREEIDEDEMEDIIDEIRDNANWNRSFMPDDKTLYDNDGEDDDVPTWKPSKHDNLYDPYSEDHIKLMGTTEDSEEPIGSAIYDDHLSKDDLEAPDFVYDNISFEVPLIETMTEEDKVLRYEPSSNDARNQFIKMELAEWVPMEESYSMMLSLFTFPFKPANDGDWDLKTRIIDYRVQFFGFNSKWSKEVTFADVILHYARESVFHIGEDTRHWVNYFLDYTEFDVHKSSHRVDLILDKLNNHVYHNKERDTFGFFGLSKQAMTGAIDVASRNIDNSVTYEIEFNEFLKDCML